MVIAVWHFMNYSFVLKAVQRSVNGNLIRNKGKEPQKIGNDSKDSTVKLDIQSADSKSKEKLL